MQWLMFLFIKRKYIDPLILFFSVDRGLDAQVRSDRGRVILRKGEQRLNLRAIQRPLVKSVDSFVKSLFFIIMETGSNMPWLPSHVHHHLLLKFPTVFFLARFAEPIVQYVVI